jgi:hypothetical protein
VTRAGEAPACQPVSGDFHGLPTVGLASASVWFEALAEAGPRIVRLGLTGGPNLLAETPDVAWSTARGPYRLHGGHRLWLAPESAGLQAGPDDAVEVARGADWLRLTGAPDPDFGIVRSIEIRLDDRWPVLHLRHEVRNAGTQSVHAALWAITQLPPGGFVLLPQPAPEDGHDTRPNRLLAMWPYASAEDERLTVRDGHLGVRGAPGADLKVGASVADGWAAWTRDGVALVRRWTPAPNLPRPDFGCDAEVFVTQGYTELEVLGPLVELAPGDSASLAETWELRPADAADPAALRTALDTPLDTSTLPRHEA